MKTRFIIRLSLVSQIQFKSYIANEPIRKIAEFTMFKDIKQDFDKVKEIPRSNSFDYNKLKSVINNKE